jgi:FkbM family methyltransferase
MDSTAEIKKFTIRLRDKECDILVPDTDGAKWVVHEIFTRNDYPIVPFIGEVCTIVDIGANVGISAAYFRSHYSQAKIYVFEPDPDAVRILAHNATTIEDCIIYNIGLYNADMRTQFFRGASSSTHSSVRANNRGGDAVEIVLRDAGKALKEIGLTEIDILKIDTEGCEMEIITSLRSAIKEVKVIYLEVHSESVRRAMDAFLAPTHILWAGSTEFAYRSQLCFVNRVLLPDDLPVKPLDGVD